MSSGSEGRIRSTGPGQRLASSRAKLIEDDLPTLTFLLSGSVSPRVRDAGRVTDAAELGRLMVLGEGGTRAVVDPRRAAKVIVEDYYDGAINVDSLTSE